MPEDKVYDKFYRDIANLTHPNEKLIKTHCSYCGMQCGMNLRVDTSKIGRAHV